MEQGKSLEVYVRDKTWMIKARCPWSSVVLASGEQRKLREKEEREKLELNRSTTPLFILDDPPPDEPGGDITGSSRIRQAVSIRGTLPRPRPSIKTR